MRKIHLFILLVLISFSNKAETGFKINPRVISIQDQMVKLRLKKAEQLIQLELQADPSNLAAVFYQNFLACYRILITQNQEAYQAYKKDASNWLEKFEDWETNSPYKNYAIAHIHMQLGFCEVLFNNYLGAAYDFWSSFKMSQKLYHEKPDFLPNQKLFGLLSAAFGTFPEQYKWVIRAIGIEGDYEKGLHLLKDYILKSATIPALKCERGEALFAYSFLRLNYSNQREQAWEFIKKNSLDYTESPAIAYLRAYAAEKSFEPEECINTCNNRPKGPDFEEILLFDYLLGSAKLNLLEKDASIYLKKYVTFHAGSFLKKDAYRKLAWDALLNNNQEKFKTYRLLSIKYNALSEEEKCIENDLKKEIYPSSILIKARLLFDAGHYMDALKLLEMAPENSFSSNYQKLEWHYRKARIFYALKNYKLAQFHFNQCIQFKQICKTYMVPNAYLQLAYIAEFNNQKKTAIELTNKIFDIEKYDGQRALEQEANNALKVFR
jgi:hypothetical protein